MSRVTGFVAGLAFVCLLLIVIGTARATHQGLPITTATTPASPADAAAIKAVIDQSFWLDGIAARSFDVSQFPTVYANDSSVPLPPEASYLIARVNVSDTGAAFGDGFLDYKRAFYYHWQAGAAKEQQMRATALAEGPGATPTPWTGVVADHVNIWIDSPRGSAVTPVPQAGGRNDPNYHTPLKFQSIAVNGDHGEAVFDSGMVQERMYLLRTQAGWRIIGEDRFNIHG